MFKYRFHPMNDNQDGCQNGCRQVWSLCTCGHSNLVIYHQIASKFHKWIASIKSSPKFEHGFCLITKMATKIATSYRFAMQADSNLVIYHQISSKVHIWTTFIKLFPKIYCGYFPMNDNQDPCLNGCLPVSLHV